MEETNSPASSRTVRFKPRAPSRKKPHSVTPKTEVEEEDAGAAAEAELLLRRFKENLGKQGNKVPKTSSGEVAFEQGVSSSTPGQTYSVFRNERNGPSASKLRSSGTGKGVSSSLPPTPKEDSLAICSDLSDGVHQKIKEYREPWDYEHSYYPTSLPLRPPYSGDPEILDEAEFGEAARNKEYDESSIKPASELGLLDGSDEERFFFFQLPPKLPIVKRPAASVKGKEIIDASSSSKASRSTGQCNLEDLPEGYMGKLQVYKSGKIKLKLGENLYDVSPGLDRIFQENVAAVNASDRKFCVLGDIEKRAIVTPDIDSVLDTFIDLD